MKFNVHKNDANLSSGLRGFFEYRDLGIADATEGKVNAHVIKAVSGHEKMVLVYIFISLISKWFIYLKDG